MDFHLLYGKVSDAFYVISLSFYSNGADHTLEPLRLVQMRDVKNGRKKTAGAAFKHIRVCYCLSSTISGY